MARIDIIESDFSGDRIAPGTGAKVTVKFNDGRKSVIELDATDAEVEEMVQGRGRRVARRGRKPRDK